MNTLQSNKNKHFLLRHIKPDPVAGAPELDSLQFMYFALQIEACKTELQCLTMMDWIDRVASGAVQAKKLHEFIMEKRAEIAGNGQYVRVFKN